MFPPCESLNSGVDGKSSAMSLDSKSRHTSCDVSPIARHSHSSSRCDDKGVAYRNGDLVVVAPAAGLLSSTVETRTAPWKHLWMMLLPGLEDPPKPCHAQAHVIDTTASVQQTLGRVMSVWS